MVLSSVVYLLSKILNLSELRDLIHKMRKGVFLILEVVMKIK